MAVIQTAEVDRSSRIVAPPASKSAGCRSAFHGTDEPTASLDYGNEVHILRAVRKLAREGKSVLMTTHQPEHALGYANRAVLMRDGAIVADGRPDDAVTSERLNELYRVPIHVAGVLLPGSGGREVRTCIAIPWRCAACRRIPKSHSSGAGGRADSMAPRAPHIASVGNKGGRAMTEIPAAYMDLMQQKKAFANLATVMRDGSPQVTPVWFDYTNGHVRVNTAKGRVKARTLQEGASVAMAIMDPDNPYRYLRNSRQGGARDRGRRVGPYRFLGQEVPGQG